MCFLFCFILLVATNKIVFDFYFFFCNNIFVEHKIRISFFLLQSRPSQNIFERESISSLFYFFYPFFSFGQVYYPQFLPRKHKQLPLLSVEWNISNFPFRAHLNDEKELCGTFREMYASFWKYISHRSFLSIPARI